MLPARAGMVPSPGRSQSRCAGAPRASGDGPDSASKPWPRSQCSPRERGWSRLPHRPRGHGSVLPARAGMVPLRACFGRRTRCAPRASGDGPGYGFNGRWLQLCSPRERGWSRGGSRRRTRRGVLPARAGMVRPRPAAARSGWGAPRASGDGPADQVAALLKQSCSPRERGWSLAQRVVARDGGVLPARAGMVPHRQLAIEVADGAPRASGDGPRPAGPAPTPCSCSPRERGWSRVEHDHSAHVGVLPARAGMVPSGCGRRRRRPSAPRASGDGPARKVSGGW